MYPEKDSATMSQELLSKPPPPRKPDLVVAAEEIRHREVSRALRRLGLSPEAEKTVDEMTRSLVDRLVSGPITDAVPSAGSSRLDEPHPNISSRMRESQLQYTDEGLTK